MKNLSLGREVPRPMPRSMTNPYPSMNDEQEFIDVLFIELEERNRQIQQLLRLLQEKRLWKKIADSRVDESC